MDIGSVFSSTKNKHFLWEFINKNNWFSDIPENKMSEVTKLFEKNISDVMENDNRGKTLVECNKIFLEKTRMNLQTARAPSNKRVSFEDLSDKKISTIEEEHRNRQSAFNNSLKSRQDEFASLLKRPSPAKVEFEDTKSDPRIKDMDDKVQEMLLERKSQLNQIYETYKKPVNLEKEDITIRAKEVEVINISEIAHTKEDNDKEDNAKEDNAKEDNAKEDNAKIDDLKQCIEKMNETIKGLITTQTDIMTILNKIKII
tara:strand:+ start:42 stop:815 length:774 start_codon:yes stop_codon:yes gene_type:complete